MKLRGAAIMRKFILVAATLLTVAVGCSKYGPTGISMVSNSVDMEFVYIKPGSFMMGSPRGESGRGGDEVLHRVALTKGLYMQTIEVTQEQWKEK
jgi:formylglycine-generating enzyme required for sulfatase activity